MAEVLTYTGDDDKPAYVFRPPSSTETWLAIAARAVPPGKSWSLIDSAAIPVDPNARRAVLNPFARAFFEVLKFFPEAGFAHMLDRYTQTVAALRTSDPYHSLVVWDQRIVQIERLNPDMDAFATYFGKTPELVDLICEAALLLEGPGTTEAKVTALISLLVANGVTPVVPT